jgi:hypothetical protein
MTQSHPGHCDMTARQKIIHELQSSSSQKPEIQNLRMKTWNLERMPKRTVEIGVWYIRRRTLRGRRLYQSCPTKKMLLARSLVRYGWLVQSTATLGSRFAGLTPAVVPLRHSTHTATNTETHFTMATETEPEPIVYYKRVDNIKLSKSTKKVTLVSSDDQKFTLDVKAAILSKFLRRTLYSDAGVNFDNDDGNDDDDEDIMRHSRKKKDDMVVEEEAAEKEEAEDEAVEEPEEYQDIPVVKASGAALAKIVEFLNYYQSTERLHKIRIPFNAPTMEEVSLCPSLLFVVCVGPPFRSPSLALARAFLY